MNPTNPEIVEKAGSETHDQTVEPLMYKVFLLNDDYTTMDFVVEILIYVFTKAPEDAARIMLSVHQQGAGLCGVYTHEIAETKVDAVHRLARERDFPLKCVMEKE